MSLFDCIDRAMREGLMDKERGRRAQELTRILEAEYGKAGDPFVAKVLAAADVKRVFREESLAKRQHTLDMIRTQRRLAKNMDGYRDITGGEEKAGALPALLEYDQAARFESVRGIREALRSRYHRMIGDFLGRFQRDMLGRVQRRGELPNVVRELFGEGTSDAGARELAQAIGKAFEQARLDFNAAGGKIGKLEDFGLPHVHDSSRMRAAGREAWISAIMPRLDWGRITDFQSGKPFTSSTQPRRRAFLSEIYDDVTTDGWAKREASFGTAGARAMFNRRADHRVLHFHSADDWLAYNEAFGRSDPFSTIVSHLDGMARDTALMRVLGPNPRAGLEFAIKHMTKKASTDPWKVEGVAGLSKLAGVSALEQVEDKATIARRMLGMTMGEHNRGGNRFWAQTFAASRSFLVAGQLGSAMLSAVGDVAFGGMAARHIGLGATRPMMRQFRMMASRGMRQEALRLGVVADMASNAGIAASRYALETTAPAVADRLADSVLRLSYLTQWTELGRHAFTIETYGLLAEMAPKGWDELPDAFRRLFLEARGFDAADWDAIRATPLHRTTEGATLLIPDDIRGRADLDLEKADGLALRLSAAIFEQGEFAVPSYSLRGQANALMGTQAGTVAGELLRSIAGYRGFTITLFVNNLRRMILADRRDPRAVQLGAFLALTTFAGALSVQLKEISKGRDPQPMDENGFWWRAALQGGGLGIFGDFIAGSETRFGSGWAETIAGPMIGATEDVGELTIGNLIDLAQGDDANFGRDLTRFLRQYTPGSGLWYLQAAFHRLGFDMLQRAMDPEAEAAWRRKERRRRRDYGNESWWRPGEPAPDRAPDLTAIAGD